MFYETTARTNIIEYNQAYIKCSFNYNINFEYFYSTDIPSIHYEVVMNNNN